MNDRKQLDELWLRKNVNHKSERIVIVSILLSTLWFSNVEPSSAIGLSMGSAPVVRVQPSYPDDELENLLETGNFGGQLGWFSGQAKNVPPKVKAEQNVADEMTLIDSFESHVMGITPAPAYESSSVDEGSNPGFTPQNSFESDVMGITPLDSSSSDYQI